MCVTEVGDDLGNRPVELRLVNRHETLLQDTQTLYGIVAIGSTFLRKMCVQLAHQLDERFDYDLPFAHRKTVCAHHLMRRIEDL
jgi:hypothetical protein